MAPVDGSELLPEESGRLVLLAQTEVACAEDGEAIDEHIPHEEHREHLALPLEAQTLAHHIIS